MAIRVSTYSRPTDLVLADYAEIDPLLVSLLEKCTPHGEEHRIVELIRQLPFVKQHKLRRDPTLNNLIIYVGESRTLFSCHMDIVGSNSKYNEANGDVDRIYLLTPDPDNKENFLKQGMIYGAKALYNEAGEFTKYEPSTLGADDKVGVYILLKMIEKNIPGVYIFHTGEECGAKGSTHLAKKHKKIFENIDRAIAFDRAGYGDVIAHQRGRRCASIEFTDALAAELNKNMPPKQQFKGNIHGSFTDTASYMDFIPECSNVSVGYFNQHGSSEHLDVLWVKSFLLNAILQVDFEKLPTKRDPSKTEYESYGGNNYYGNYGNNVTNLKKAAWKDVDKNTKYYEWPEWSPKLGYVRDASEEVLQTAIGRYITNCNYGQKKDELAKHIIDLYNYIDILEDEIVSKQAVINQLSGKNPVSQEIDAKRALLTKLIVLTDKIILPEEQKDWLTNYSNGAKKFLERIGNSNKLSEKQIEKCNRIIFAMATLIDEAPVLSKEEEYILMEVEEHIGDTASQSGWFTETKGASKKLDKKKIVVH
jgi:hypothetical protein